MPPVLFTPSRVRMTSRQSGSELLRKRSTVVPAICNATTDKRVGTGRPTSLPLLSIIPGSPLNETPDCTRIATNHETGSLRKNWQLSEEVGNPQVRYRTTTNKAKHRTWEPCGHETDLPYRTWWRLFHAAQLPTTTRLGPMYCCRSRKQTKNYKSVRVFVAHPKKRRKKRNFLPLSGLQEHFVFPLRDIDNPRGSLHQCRVKSPRPVTVRPKSMCGTKETQAASHQPSILSRSSTFTSFAPSPPPPPPPAAAGPVSSARLFKKSSRSSSAAVGVASWAQNVNRHPSREDVQNAGAGSSCKKIRREGREAREL